MKRIIKSYIVVSLALSLIFGLSFKVREGTVIGMILLGPIMVFLWEHFEKGKIRSCFVPNVNLRCWRNYSIKSIVSPSNEGRKNNAWRKH